MGYFRQSPHSSDLWYAGIIAGVGRGRVLWKSRHEGAGPQNSSSLHFIAYFYENMSTKYKFLTSIYFQFTHIGCIIFMEDKTNERQETKKNSPDFDLTFIPFIAHKLNWA